MALIKNPRLRQLLGLTSLQPDPNPLGQPTVAVTCSDHFNFTQNCPGFISCAAAQPDFDQTVIVLLSADGIQKLALGRRTRVIMEQPPFQETWEVAQLEPHFPGAIIAWRPL